MCHCDCVQGVYSVHSVYSLHRDTASATEWRGMCLLSIRACTYGAIVPASDKTEALQQTD